MEDSHYRVARIGLRAIIFLFGVLKNVARDFWSFGSGSKNFSRQNEKLLARDLQDSGATIQWFSVRKLPFGKGTKIFCS